MHLTFKFLGDTSGDSVAPILAGLDEAANGVAPFDLEPGGLGTFPERGRPRVIWLGACPSHGIGHAQGMGPAQHGAGCEAARELHARVEAALTARGVPRDPRPFLPHLTLGRVTGPARGDWRTAFEKAGPGGLSRFTVDGVVLFESRLRPEGAVYVALDRLALRGPGRSGGSR